jgi:hypothetical protein
VQSQEGLQLFLQFVADACADRAEGSAKMKFFEMFGKFLVAAFADACDTVAQPQQILFIFLFLLLLDAHERVDCHFVPICLASTLLRTESSRASSSSVIRSFSFRFSSINRPCEPLTSTSCSNMHSSR